MGRTFKTTSLLFCKSRKFLKKKEVLAFSRENNFCILFKHVGKKIPSLS